MNIPLIDLKQQYNKMEKDLKRIVGDVLDSQKYILGPYVEEFETNIAKYCNTKYALGVSSGTDALLISLLALDINEGDEIIIPSFTFFASAGVVYRVGAKPVFADIDPDTYNLDPKSFENAITDKTKAVIPVHLFGQCCNMDEIKSIAKKHNIIILEDAAQAVGSEYKGTRAGALGDIGAFSCYPTKNLGAFGEAGFITTNNDDLFEKIKMGRNHGQGSKYYHRFVGGNFRMDAVQGAVLNHKLQYLDEWTERRIKNAEYYIEEFNKQKIADEFIILPKIEFERHIFNQFTIRIKNGKRDLLKKYLAENNIGSGIYYPYPLHLQPCFEYTGFRKGDLPVTEQICDEVLSLPVYPELTEDMLSYVVGKITGFFKS